MKQALYVGFAGAIGAICRVGIGRLFIDASDFPMSTLTVNLIGTFILCLLSAGVIQRLTADKQIQTAVTTGFIGSFTTFSAFSMETVNLMQDGQVMLAIFYVAVSVIGGLAIGLFGFMIGRRMVKA